MDSLEIVKKTCYSPLGVKARAVELGYYEDEFIDKFSEPVDKSNLLNILHVVRVNAFRLVLDKFIRSFPNETVQFVNLGSGFDTISFYALKKYPNVICFDTDFDDQMKTKSKIVYENDCFKQLLPDLKLENEFITSNRYKIVPFDLSNLNDFNNLINSGLSSKYPTLYLAEFVFMYVKSETVNELVDHLYNFSSDDSVLLVSEGMFIQSGIAKYYVKIIGSIGRKVYGPCDYPSIESQIQRYSKRWNVKMVCYNEFYNMNYSEEEKKRIIELEDFKHMRELGASFSHFMFGLLYKDFHKLPDVVDLFIVKENYDYNSKDPYFVPFGVNFDPETEIDFQYFKTTCFDKILLDDPGSETIEYNTN